MPGPLTSPLQEIQPFSIEQTKGAPIQESAPVICRLFHFLLKQYVIYPANRPPLTRSIPARSCQLCTSSNPALASNDLTASA